MSRRVPLHMELDEAVRRVMAERYPDLPELYWKVSAAGQFSLRGMVHADVVGDEAQAAVLGQWVERLQLSPTAEATCAGTAEYVGAVDRWVTVEVWGVVDHAARDEADPTRGGSGEAMGRGL